MNLRFRKKISFILVLAMIVQLAVFSGAITASAATGATYEATVIDNGQDYFNAAKLKGAYIEATSPESGHVGTHINLLKGELGSTVYTSTLVPVADKEGAIKLGWTEELLAGLPTNGYVTKDKDGAWMYRAQLSDGLWEDADYVAADADIKDYAFFTQGNYRIKNSAAQGVGGSIYLNLDDTFTTNDAEITIVLEYLDLGTKTINLQFPNTTSVKGSVGYNTYSIAKTNSGLWKTVLINATDAMLKTGFSGLGTHKEDIKINANSDVLYIKRLGIIKTAELNASVSAFDVSNVSYKTDKGAYTHYVAGGNVVTTADVTNKGSEANSATLYTAVYDKNEALVDVSMSAKADIAAGETATLTTQSAVNIPNTTDYVFRKFIWTDNLTPAYSVDEADKLVLTATAYDKRILLNWSEYSSEIPMENTAFYIYRDGLLVGSTKKSAYYDDAASVGEHTWMIEAVDETTGDIIYRSNYAVATVIDKLANGGLYVKARQNSLTGFRAVNSSHSDIEGGLHLYRIANIYTLDEVQKYLTYVTDETPAEGAAQTLGQIAYAKSKNYNYISNSSDGSVRTMSVTDASGVTKDAWHSSKFLRCSNVKEYTEKNEVYIYVDVTDKSKITADDSNVTIFVEFLAKDRTNIGLQYIGYTEADDGTKTAVHKGASNFNCVNNGKWTVAQFNLTDAYFTVDASKIYSGGPDFRLVNRGGDLIVSSVYVTKATGSDAVYEYTSLRDRDFGAVKEDISNEIYPDGVSIDFSTGEAVENGIKLYATSEGNADSRASVSENGYVENTYIEVNEAPKQTRLYFEIDDNYLFGHADSKFYMEIEYIDDFTGDLKLNHAQWKSWYEVPVYGGADDKLFTGTGTGETKVYSRIIDNIQLRNTYLNGNADFYVYVPYGENRDTLKIKSIKIKNLSAVDRKYLAE